MNGATPSIGLVGLGLLGRAIAERLSKAGQSLVGFDIDDAANEAFAALGGESATDAAAVLAGAPAVVLSLPTSKDVLSVLESAAALERVGTVVDTTTGLPEDAAAIEDWVQARGGEYVEAKVAGSSLQLREGRATLFVAGREPGKAAAAPVLAMLAERRFDVGGPGDASRFKLVHNLLLGLHRAVLAEGLVLGEAMGLDPRRLLELLAESPAASSVMTTKGSRMVDRDYEPVARLAQHLKDVELVRSVAAEHETPVPLTDLHRELLAKAVAAGWGEADNTAIAEVFRGTPRRGTTAGTAGDGESTPG